MKTNLFNQMSRVFLAAAMATLIITAKASSTPPTIATEPSGASVVTGSNATFSVAATSSNLTYQWYFDSSPASETPSTNSSLAITAARKSDAGSYSVIVTNDGGSITSSVVVLVVQDPPVVTNMTGTTTNILAVGHPVNMTVQCTGDGLGFVWMKGTTVLTGATTTPSNSTYSITSVATSDSGAYTCEITNATSASATASFQLIAVPAPIITAQPAGKGLALGSNYTMSVSATGSYMNYFWSQIGTNTNTCSVGGNTNTLTITGAEYTNAGTYSVIVSNLAGSVTSSVANITVQLAAAITLQPALTNIWPTNSAQSLRVTATGDGLVYQWYKGTAALSGQSASNLAFSSLATSDAGTYSLVVSNLASKVTSSNFVVIPVVAPTITTQPAGKGLALGSNYTMSVTSTDSYLHYYWNQIGTNSQTYSVGGDTNKLTITGADYTNAGTYSVIVSNLSGTVTSSVATITVQRPPAITLQPSLTNIWPTNSAQSLSVTATGDGLVYQWYKGTAALSGQTASNLAFPSLASGSAGTYSVIVSNYASKVTSSNFLAIPVVTPTITTQPAGKGLALGSNYTMSVTASGSYLHYYWNQIATNSQTYSVGGDTNKLTITGADYTNAGTYSVIVSNLSGTVTSSVANITVQLAAGFTQQPSLTNIWPTNSLQSLSATASGDGLVYQWYKGTATLGGQTASNLVFHSLAASNAGTYSLVISNYAGKATSSNFLVIPVVAPAITTQPAGKGLALGSNYTMSVTASGSYLHYYWSQIATNSQTYPVGSDTNKLTITGADYTNAGVYSVIVSNLAAAVTSSVANITVQLSAGFTQQPSLTNIWPTNSQQTLSVTASGDGLAYQWYKGTAALSGQTASSLVFPSLVASNAGTYSLVISNYAKKLTSSNFLVIPVVAPVITTQPAGKGLALGSNYTLSVAASGTYLHYYWSQIGTNYTNQMWQETAWENVTNLVGGDTNKLTFTGAAYTNGGIYSVMVSNVAGRVTSSNVSIDVLARPTMEYQMGGATNAVGSDIYLWAIAGGDISGASVTKDGKAVTNGYNWIEWAVFPPNWYPGEPYNPDWFNDTDNHNNWWFFGDPIVMEYYENNQHALGLYEAGPGQTPGVYNWSYSDVLNNWPVDFMDDEMEFGWYPGQTNYTVAYVAVLEITNARLADAGKYQITVTNAVGFVKSANATVAVVPAPVITTQPVGKGLALGSNYTMSVTASGTYLSYFWKQIGTNGQTYSVGGNTNKLFITNAAYTNAGTYSVVVSNLDNFVVSSDVTITVQQAAAITLQPALTNIWPTNSQQSLSVTTAGDGLVCQWYKGSAALSGQNASNLVFNSLAASNAGTYSLVISNYANKVTSSNFVVIPVVAPAITTQPAGKGMVLGSNYTMSVTATGAYLHYYWSQVGTNSQTYSVGGDTNKLTLAGAAYTNAGAYSVVVSNLSGTVTSSVANITVQAPAVITTQPLASTNQRGGTISLGVVATGDGLNFLWTKDGKAVTIGTANTATPGTSTTNTLTISTAAVSNGGAYQVTVSNLATSVKSASVKVVVIAPPTLTVAATNVTILQSASGTLSVTATGTGPIGYQWSFGGTNNISGATNASYTITNMNSTNAGSYQVTATNFGGSTLTNVVVIYVADTNPPTITLTGASATFSNATLSVTGQAKDNVTVSNVEYSLDNGVTFSNAVTTNHWTNFVITNTFTNVGTNTLIVKGVDVNGNWTVPTTNHPVYAPLYTMALTVTGTGTVTSNWTGKVQWGSACSVVAAPGKNFVLVGWTGSITTNVATVKFSPTNNMTLTATFTTNLFTGLAGNYNGLFSGTNATGTNLAQSGGYLMLAVTTNQTYSGKIYVGGMSAALSGSFDPDGTLTAWNVGTNGPNLTLNLSMDFAKKAIVGTISNADWVSTNLEADLAVFSTNSPTTNAGTYTLVIPTETGEGMGSGYGYGTVSVAVNGSITFVGATADGASLSQSTTISDDGFWPLYVPLYPVGSSKVDQGLVIGWLQFTNTPFGSASWVATNGASLAASTAPIESSVFVAPAKGTSRVITNRLATITFNGAGLTNSFQETLVIADDGIVASDGQATVVISTSGLISGAMVDPATGASNKIYGIVLQKDATCLGKGSIIGKSSIGNFVITAFAP